MWYAGDSFKNPEARKVAVRWYREAAELGDPFAQEALGNHYRNGAGIEKDLKLARYWYLKAVQGGRKSAQKQLDTLSEEPRE